MSQGETYQFSATGSGTITWSLVAGSAGSINSSTGLYTAPASVAVKRSVAGCAIGAPNDIWNTDVSSLSVDSTKTTYLNANVTYPLSFGGNIPHNYIDASTPSQSLVFAYTTGNNGSFQIPTRAQGMRQENGLDTWPFISDRHIITVRSDTCAAAEIYNLYPPGTNTETNGGNNCPLCTSQSGMQYDLTKSLLPNGATNAAGTPLLYGTLTQEEIKRAYATSGQVKHAIAARIPQSRIQNSFIWPATANANAGSGSIPYGTRIRLASSFTFSSPTGNPYVPILLTQLKNYGLIMTDGAGGSNYELDVDDTVQKDSLILTAFSELRNASGLTAAFEVVDASGLNGNDGTSMVAAGNAAAPLFAAVVATDSGGSTQRQIALRGLALDVKEERVFVQAGAPARQLTAWANGASDTGVTWGISPSTGSITSGGLYTPPASTASPVIITATATSTADGAVTATVKITVLPEGTLRLRVANFTDYTDSLGAKWWGYADGSPAQFMEAGTSTNTFIAVTGTSDPLLYRTIHGAGYGDLFFRVSLPPGNYKTTFLQFGYYPVNYASYNYETQGVIRRHQLDISATAGYYAAKDVEVPLVVGSDGIANIALRVVARGGYQNAHLSALKIEADATSPYVAIERGVNFGQSLMVQTNSPYNYTDTISKGRTRQFYAQGWYQASDVTWAVQSGPGTVDANGLYSAPSTPPAATTPVVLRATSTANGTSDTITFNFVFGTMAVTPNSVSINREFPQTFAATLEGQAYTSVNWTVQSGPGSISAGGVYTPPSSLAANTAVTIRATSTDDPTQYAEASITVLRYAIPIRISGGPNGVTNPNWTDGSGNAWVRHTGAASYWSTSSTYQYAEACSNCAALGVDLNLVQGRRYKPDYAPGDVTFSATLPNGRYVVTLYWMENSGEVYTFHVDVQGVRVLPSFSVETAAGGNNIAVVQTYVATVVDNTLTVAFKHAGGSKITGVNSISVVEQESISTSGNAVCQAALVPGAESSVAGFSTASTPTYLWRQTSGPTRAVFGDARTASLMLRNVVAGLYAFSLTVTSGGSTYTCAPNPVAIASTTATSRTYSVSFALASVTGATKARVRLTGPSGTETTNTCTASPCSITATEPDGVPIVRIEYMNNSDAVLAAADAITP